MDNWSVEKDDGLVAGWTTYKLKTYGPLREETGL